MLRDVFIACAGLLCILTTIELRADDEVQLPDTPVGQQASALLEVLAAQDRDQLLAFIKGNFSGSFLEAIPLESHVDANRGFADSTGGVVPIRVVSANDTKLRFVGRAKRGDGQWQVIIEVEAEPPHKIASLGFMQPPAWSEVKTPSTPSGDLTREQFATYLDQYLGALEGVDAFSGAVLVAHDQERLFQQAYGLASRAWQAPNRLDTKFNLGSMNKMFTAVATAQLVEQGKLSLDDTVAQHLPSYPNQEAAKRITVRHLLSHTSGLSDYFNERFVKTSRDQFRTINDYLPLFADEPLQFEPGTRFQYSNAGFMVLGAMIEAVSGQDYFEYVREHIYEPAGMQNSDCYELDRDTPNLAVGYTRQSSDGEEWKNNIFLHVIRGGPAGGGYSTVEDLLRFATALQGGTLMKAETLAQWTTPGEHNKNYGLGFELYNEQGTSGFGHRGGFPGVSSMLRVDRDLQLTTVVLSNMDSGVMPVYDKLGELMPKLDLK